MVVKDIRHFPVDVPSAFIKDGKVVQPIREVPVFHEADVAVIGGGPAGFAAALASARSGARTVLIERYGSLGGLFTNGLVLIIVGTAEGTRYGEQRLVTRGICEEFMNRCKVRIERIFIVLHGPDEEDPFLPVEITGEAKKLAPWINDHIWDLNRIKKQKDEPET